MALTSHEPKNISESKALGFSGFPIKNLEKPMFIRGRLLK